MSGPPLNVSLKAFQTGTSYICVLARYCGLVHPTDLCLDWGFRWQDFVRGDDFLFEKVATIGGVSADNLKRWSVRSREDKTFRVSGHVGTRSTFTRTRVRICPHCIKEDIERGGIDASYQRFQWHFTALRTCPLHNHALISLPQSKYTIHNYDFIGQIEKHYSLLEEAWAHPAGRRASAFEQYVFARLCGKNTGSFLDSFPISISTRLCEVLGFVLAFGPDRALRQATEDELSKAGQVGFEALSKDESGLYEALRSLVTPTSLQTVRHQSDMGAFFEWLRLSKFGPDFERLKDLVREFIFRTYPCQPGDKVLGKVCEEQRIHTIASAWSTVGIQRKRMNRFLLDEGLATVSQANVVTLNEPLTSEQVSGIKEKLNTSLDAVDACKHLGVSLDFLKGLKRADILVPKSDGLNEIPKYDAQAVQGFLDQLFRRARAEPVGEHDLVPISEAAPRARTDSSHILALILDRRLQAYFGAGRLRRVDDLLVSLSELKSVIVRPEMEGLTKGQVAQALRVTYRTVTWLTDRGLLETKLVLNPRTRQRVNAVQKTSLKAFSQTHVTLGQLAHRYQRHAGPFGRHLETKGVWPMAAPEGVSWIYERARTQSRLKRLGYLSGH